MKSVVYGLAGLLLCPLAYAQEDDSWLMLDVAPPARSGLQLNAGSDFAGGHYYGASLSQALGAAQFYASANQQQYDVTTSDWSVGIGSNPLNDFSVRIDTAWAGDTDVLETRDKSIETSTQVAHWLFMLGYQSGEAEIFLPASPLIKRSSYTVDRNAWHVGVGYNWNSISLSAEHRQFDYAENIRIAVDDTSIRNLIRTYVLSQAEALADQQTRVRFGAVDNNNGLDISLSRITSAIDLIASDYVTLVLTHYFAEDFSLGVQWEKPLDTGNATLGVNAGWQW
jgi:hypothetical protein